MFEYSVIIEPDDNDTFMVTFPEVPEAVSFGDTQSEAIARAADALETALTGYILDRRDLPTAIATLAAKVGPSLLGSLKLSVYAAMRAKGWRKADLARAMSLNPRQVDRLLDLRHASTVAQLDQALAICGKRATIETHALIAA